MSEAQIAFQRNALCANTEGAPVLPEVEDTHGDHYKYSLMRTYAPVPVQMKSPPKNQFSCQFFSEFESGNLERAYCIAENEYVLILQFDTETLDYSHWYYFQAKAKPLSTIRFHIINMMRPEPLVAEGMRPLAFSKPRKTWEPCGEAVEFSETVAYKHLLPENTIKYFTLSFTYTFPADSVFFAYSYPYTYAHLDRFLNKLALNPHVQVHTLAKTLCGNTCKYLKITDFSYTSPRKAIVLTSRVHAGETNSSYMMEGFIKRLLASEILLREFVFFIVPMLNPDGVRHGNYRCSALGVDLNRRWISPNSTLHPTIYHTKKLIAHICSKHQISMFCDFHGHSKKTKAFMYGCFKQSKKNAKNPSIVVPALMSAYNPLFSYNHCHFRIDKSKISTARVVVHKEFGVQNSYTLECSMFGARNYPFTIADIETIGRDLCRACEGFVNSLTLQKSIERAEKLISFRKKMKKEKIKRSKSAKDLVKNKVVRERLFTLAGSEKNTNRIMINSPVLPNVLRKNFSSRNILNPAYKLPALSVNTKTVGQYKSKV